MAKKEAKKEAVTAPANQKYNSSSKKRSTADLKGTEKGNIIRVIRGAVSLTNLKVGDKKESKKLARAAVPSLQKGDYSNSVKDLISFCLDTLNAGGGGGGRKGFNPGAFADITL